MNSVETDVTKMSLKFANFQNILALNVKENTIRPIQLNNLLYVKKIVIKINIKKQNI